MLEVREVSKSYGLQQVLRQVSLTVPEGQFFSLLGPSGCGKTTLLRLVGGFERVDSGSIFQDGLRVDHLPPHQRQLNTVFQRYALFPHLNVWENVAFGLRMKKVRGPELSRRVSEALALTQMEPFSKRSIATLSGGQQQRIALARAIVNRPKILLLDEPLSALDLKLRRQMQVDLLSLQRRLGHSFIFVTHDQEEALTLSDRVAVMEKGLILQVGTPQEIYEAPKTRFASSFIGSMNYFEVKPLEVRPGEIMLQGMAKFPFMVRPSRDGLRSLGILNPAFPVQLMVRPEKMRILKSQPGPEVNSVEGTIKEILYQGAMTRFLVVSRDSSQTWMVDQANNAAFAKKGLQQGEKVFVSWSPEDGSLLQDFGG